METIKCQTNSMSKITIVTDADISFIVIEGDKRYYDVHDGYVHLVADREYSPSEIEVIKKINILYFAGKLPEIRTSLETITHKSIPMPLPISQTLKSLLPSISIRDMFGRRSLRNLRIQWNPKRTSSKMLKCVVPFELQLGGSWQKFYNGNWLADAEQIKGGQIFLAR